MQLPEGWYIHDADDDIEPLRDIHGWFGLRTPRGVIASFPTREAADALLRYMKLPLAIVTAIEATAILAMAAARIEMEGT